MNNSSYDSNQPYGVASTQRQQQPQSQQQQQQPGYYSNYNSSYGSPQLYTNKHQSAHSPSTPTQQQQTSRYDQPPQSQTLQQQQPASLAYSSGGPRQQSRANANYESQWQLYSADWAHSSPQGLDLLAVSTYTEESSNKIQIVQGFSPNNGAITPTTTSAGGVGDSSSTLMQQPSLEFQKVADYTVPYPCTKIGWAPASLRSNLGSNANSGGANMQLITTGDCLRLWTYNSDNTQLQQRCALINKTKSSYMPPVTSFDWNRTDPSIVITSSIDTTCTVWDIAASTAHTQLIAHDSEVFDVSFVANSTHIFASVGADGSVRVFDLRSLDHSTIIYEPQQPVPLVRIVGNPLEENSLAALAANTNEIYILDVRAPGVPVATLTGHKAPVNSIAWAPAAAAAATNRAGSSHSYRHILASGADDCQALIWDVSESSVNPKVQPHGTDAPVISAYTDTQEINYVTWNSDASWLGVVRGRGVQAVKL